MSIGNCLIFVCALVSVNLDRFGSDKLKKEFLVPAISGEMVTCIGVSEPHAGSDVASKIKK